MIAMTTVTPEYFGHLDMAQRRLDINDRPELRLGSVDFVVGKDYWVQESDPASTLPPREPSPLSFVFAIDISWTSGRIGLVQEVVEGLKELLYPEVIEGQPAPLRLPAGSKIAIMTFDKTVQFYNLKVSSTIIRSYSPSLILTTFRITVNAGTSSYVSSRRFT